MARNGHASFHVAISVPHGQNYLLFAVTNPIDACRLSLYKEHFVKANGGWVPDRLTELTRLPDFGVIPDPEAAIEGQTTRLYLLDVWIPPDAPVSRFRLEVQLKMGDWTIRPMEIRIVEARYPDIAAARNPALPSPGYAADAVPLAALSKAPAASGEPLTVRDILYRNAMQDGALARALKVNLAARALDLWRVNTPYRPRPMGSEWYLRVRESLFRDAEP